MFFYPISNNVPRSLRTACALLGLLTLRCSGVVVESEPPLAHGGAKSSGTSYARGGATQSARGSSPGAGGSSAGGASSNGGGGSTNASAASGGTTSGGRTSTGGSAGSSNSTGGASTNAGASGVASNTAQIKFGFSCNGVEDGTLAEWLSSHTIAMAGTWNDTTAEVQTEQYTLGNGFGDWNKDIDDAIGGIFKGETWAQAANGDFDDRWRETVRAIKKAWGSRNPALLNVRFAHEFNLAESQWRVSGADVGSFRRAWTRFYGIFKETLPTASLVWCPNDGTSGSLDLDIRDAYPGNEFVDVICIDTYNQWPWVDDAESFQEKIHRTEENGAPIGAEAWRAWAEQQGKPFSIGEWASNGDPEKADDGGDSPDYIQRFRDWLLQHGGSGPGKIKYAVFFNSYTQFEVFPDTMQPNAAAAVRKLF